MTQEEKAKAYDKVLINARMFYKDDHVSDDVNNLLEVLFPELAESEDERIREKLIDTFNFYNPAMNSPFLLGIHKKDILAWLEKQESVGEIVERCKTSWYNEGKIQGQIEELSDEEKYQQGWHDALEKQGEQKSAEWHKGDEQNLNACLGYIPDEYLRRWLMDVIHVKYDKPTDKIEPKFHKGQWIVWQDECYKVNYNGCGYELVDKNGLSILLDYGTIDENAHLWDVAKDAKPGDVLYSQKHNLIWIYKDNKHYYASINLNYADGISFDSDIVIPSDVCPANREQRNILFQKIEEANYKWDDNKKKLKKIKKNDYEPDTLIEESYQQQADDLIDMVTEKPVWSEEDEKIRIEKLKKNNYDKET